MCFLSKNECVLIAVYFPSVFPLVVRGVLPVHLLSVFPVAIMVCFWWLLLNVCFWWLLLNVCFVVIIRDVFLRYLRFVFPANLHSVLPVNNHQCVFMVFVPPAGACGTLYIYMKMPSENT